MSRLEIPDSSLATRSDALDLTIHKILTYEIRAGKILNIEKLYILQSSRGNMLQFESMTRLRSDIVRWKQRLRKGSGGARK
jgi:hypothetical protein